MTEKLGDGTEGTEGQTTLAEAIRRGTELQMVSDLFTSLVTDPDRILIPNPADRANNIIVNALIIPDTLLARLPADISTVRMNREQTVSGVLVALFIPNSTPAIEYRLYRRLPYEERGRKVIHTPLDAPFKTHGVIYDQQKPAVQHRLLVATIQAINGKKLQEQVASSKPPWSKIFKP